MEDDIVVIYFRPGVIKCNLDEKFFLRYDDCYYVVFEHITGNIFFIKKGHKIFIIELNKLINFISNRSIITTLINIVFIHLQKNLEVNIKYSNIV